VFDSDPSAFEPRRHDGQDVSLHGLDHRSIGRPPIQRYLEGDGIRIEWPWTSHGRARKVLSRSGARRRYVVPCFRSVSREAHCEAEEERDAAILLDACAGIQFQEQPAKLVFTLAGERYEHWPDLLVVSDGRREFWECKDERSRQDLFIRHRTARLQELLAPLRYGYRVVSTNELNQGSYLANAILMRRRHALPIPPEVRGKIRTWLAALPPTQAQVLGAFLPSDPFGLLCCLLYAGAVRGQLREPISLEMTIRPSLAEEDVPWVWEVLEKIS